MERGNCKCCGERYENEPGDDAYETGMCYHCFEESLEEHEERKRERIARANEY